MNLPTVQCQEPIAYSLEEAAQNLRSPRYLTLGEVAKSLPTRPSAQTVFRWATTGCRGIRLESLRFGRRIVVTPEALDKFARELAEVWDKGRPESPTSNERQAKRTRTAQQREKAAQVAEKNLRAKGLLT